MEALIYISLIFSFAAFAISLTNYMTIKSMAKIDGKDITDKDGKKIYDGL